MKRMKLWVVVAFAVIGISGILVAFAIEQTRVKPIKTSQIGEPPQPPWEPPENATLIPELSAIPFDLSLDTSEIRVPKGESVNITVTIRLINRSIDSPEEVSLLLVVGTGNYTPFWVPPELPPELQTRLQPELPPGIMASLERTNVSVEEGSPVTVNLTLSIGDEAAFGRYALEIFAIQKTSYGAFYHGVPLWLTIP